MNYGRGELPDEHPQSIWDCGNLGLTVALQQADVLLVAGLRFNWLLQSGELIPPGTKIVRIDIDPHELDRNRAVDVGLAGDVGLVLEQLTSLVEERDHSRWLSTLRAASRSMLDYELRTRETAAYPIHPIRLAAQIRKFVGDDAYYVVDGGYCIFWPHRFMSRHRAGVIVLSGLLGCLGRNPLPCRPAYQPGQGCFC